MTKLFCVPYAGGSAVVFNKWRDRIASEIELRPVELAGRGARINEALYADLQSAVEDMIEIIRKETKYSPYALFGHSMGALIAYEVAQQIMKIGIPKPIHLFFSGKSAPHVKRKDAKIFHLMNDNDFAREVIELGGTQPEFFQHPELLEVFLPVMKNDFRLAETAYSDKPILPFDVDITVFLGKDDDQTPEQCDGWKRHTAKNCMLHYFEGGHFFLFDKAEQVINIINNTFKALHGQKV